jgi:hypothetical protein
VSPADGQNTRLIFKAVYGDARVSLNGIVLGINISPFREFEVDLTRALVAGSNTLEVEVDNSRTSSLEPTQWTFYGRALLMLRSTGEPGVRRVRATSRSHGDAAVELTAESDNRLSASRM